MPRGAVVVLNWGPRETIVAGIEFLTEYAEAGNLVVYQGTATTSPLSYLAECFPTLKAGLLVRWT